jgi:hypothetical protein
MAQLPNQGGIGDPLTLAISGVIIPFITGAEGGTVALVEIASPVSANPDLHMVFFNNTCARVGESVGIGETENDIAFQQIENVLPASTTGLVLISGVQGDGFTAKPLTSPIHSRVYLFDGASGRSRVLEPIIADTAEFSSSFSGWGANLWSPLRTAATFYSPVVTATIKTELTLVCPRETILGLVAKAAIPDDPNTPGDESKPAVSASYWGGPVTPGDNTTNLGFPVIAPPFKKASVANDMRARIYDTNEVFKRDVRFTCDCLTPDFSVTNISTIYSDAVEAPNGTYTEIEVSVASPQTGSFTGYRGVFAVGSPLNNFFGRLSNGNRTSIQGGLTNAR